MKSCRQRPFSTHCLPMRLAQFGESCVQGLYYLTVKCTPTPSDSRITDITHLAKVIWVDKTTLRLLKYFCFRLVLVGLYNRLKPPIFDERLSMGSYFDSWATNRKLLGRWHVWMFGKRLVHWTRQEVKVQDFFLRLILFSCSSSLNAPLGETVQFSTRAHFIFTVARFIVWYVYLFSVHLLNETSCTPLTNRDKIVWNICWLPIHNYESSCLTGLIHISTCVHCRSQQAVWLLP